MPVEDQLVNLIRFALSFIIVFTFWPAYLFKSEESTAGDRFMDRFAKMVLLVIVLGYLLISIRLYELLTMAIILLLFPLLRRISFRGKRQFIEDQITKLNILIYRFLDGEIKPWRKVRQAMAGNTSVSALFSLLVPQLLLLFVLLVSAYLRFHDALTHAAPAMSDSYVTLAWMKYLEENILFHDGIYPQGFYFYLTVLRKFAGQDSIYVLKYAGPLNGVLVTYAIYLFVRRLTASPYAGIFAAFIFGALGQFLPITLERQAATNSQEFALVFLVPAWHFTIGYLEGKNKKTLVAALACYTITGLVHTLIFAFVAIGVICIILAYLIVSPRASFKAAWQLALAGIISGMVSALPLLAGMLAGKEFHASSLNFLTSRLDVVIPHLTVFDQALFLGAALYVLAVLLFPSLRRTLGRALAIILLSGLSYLLYCYLAPYSGNAVLISRIGILWSVVVCLGIGLGWGAVTYGLPRFLKGKIEALFCFAVVVLGIVYFHPTAPEPYKMQYDCMVNQYLHLSKDYTPTTWMMVSSEEGYDLALGKGWHMHLNEFAENYSPATQKIYRLDDTKAVLEIQNIFIFIEKEMLRPPFKEMETILARREYYYGKLETWAKQYARFHDNLQTYYEDDKIKVYHIRQVEEKDESLAEIWGVQK